MVKYFFIFIFLILTSISFADREDAAIQAQIQQDYGHDLTHVPFFLRFAYIKEFGKDWKETDYIERQVFLVDYEKSLIKEKKLQDAEDKQEAQKEKERLQEKKAAMIKARNRLKAQLAEEKSEDMADANRQKEFDQSIAQQEKDLQQMEQEISHR